MDDEVFSLEALWGDWDASPEWTQTPETSSDDARASRTRSTLCRRRQREELLRLRSETVELEQKLHRLRSEHATSVASAAKSVWQRVAEYQRKLKLEVEAENARLRRLVDEQRGVAAKLEKVVHASRSIQEVCEQELLRTKSRRTTAARVFSVGGVDDVCVSPPQDNEIQAMRSDVFSNDGIECERVDFTTDADGRVVMESIYHQVFQFDLQTTTAAVWRCYSTTSIDFSDGSYSANTTPSGLLVGLVELPVKVEGKTIVMWSQCQLRCFQKSSDRVLIVWEDMSEANAPLNTLPPRSDCTAGERVQMKFDVYIGLETLRGQPNPSTVMRARSFSRPGARRSVVEDPLRTSKAQLTQVAQVFNRCFTQEIEAYLHVEALRSTAVSV